MKRIHNLKSWLIGIIIFLIAIHFLFSVQAPFKWLEAVWNAGDFISFIGTLALGYIAVKQADEANKGAEAANNISNRLMDLEFERYKLENRPFVMVSSWNAENLRLEQIYIPDRLYIQVDSYDENKPILGISLFIQNTTNAPLYAEFDNCCIDEQVLMNTIINQSNHKICLQPLGIQEIVFFASEDMMLKWKGKILKMQFVLENRFAVRYQETFKIIVGNIGKIRPFLRVGWICNLSPQNFEIGKFVKNTDGQFILVMEDL